MRPISSAILMFVLSLAGSVAARDASVPSVWDLETRRPAGPGDDGLGFGEGAWMLRATAPWPGVPVVVDFPVVLASQGANTITPGNPFVGVVLANPRADLRFTAGVRFPLATVDDRRALVIGQRSTFFDHVGAYAIDTITARFAMQTTRRWQRDLHARVDLGVVSLNRIRSGRDDGVFALASVALDWSTERLLTSAALRGAWQASLENADFAEATIQEFFVRVARRNGRVRPAVSIAIGLDEDLRRGTNAVVGASVSLVPWPER